MLRRKFFKITLSGVTLIMLPMNGILFSKPIPAGKGVKGLKAGFTNPPDSAKPRTWWHWMNGNITKHGIKLDLEAMHEIGLGGFQLFDATCGIPEGPVNYNSEDWHRLLDYSIREADSLGLKMTFHNCAGWSSSGGPWITPETSMKKLVWSELQLKGPAGKSLELQLEKPEILENFYRDIRVIAFPTPEGERNGNEGFRIEKWRTKGSHDYLGSMWVYQRNNRPGIDTRTVGGSDVIPAQHIIDLTDSMEDSGRLDWEVPPGHWTVVRFGYTSTGKTNHPAPAEGVGLECDKLSTEGAEAHWNGIIARVMQTGGTRTGQTFNSILIDSYEARAQNWTGEFPGEFIRRKGYDLFKYLPCLTGRVVESLEISEKFLWDFRRTVADMFADNYYGHFARLCEQNGLELYVQPYGRIGKFDELANAGQGHIPMGEFWVNRYDFGMAYSSKLAASSAHVRGKKYVASETFTAGHKDAAWINHPYSLKALGDYFYCQGINRFYFAEFAHQPWSSLGPGMTLGPFGFQFNRANTWWKQSRAWISYLSRTQYMLQQGHFVADLCYWFGENVPNTLDNADEIKPASPPGYDYDALVTGILHQLQVENGELTLPGGMRYRVLAMPHFERTIRPEVLKKIRDLVREGATITGPPPVKSPTLSGYPGCDEEVRHVANELWGSTNGRDKTLNNYGKGRVYWGKDLKDIFSDLGIIPDFSYSGDNDPAVEYIHRRTDMEDIYFISNQEHRFVTLQCSFRVSGKIPEIWDPQTGDTRQLVMYQLQNGYTRISLVMEPAGSLFVVFRIPNNVDIPGTNVLDENRDIHQLISFGSSLKLEIIEANYGILEEPSETIDVTGQLAERIDRNYLRMIPGRDIREDPAPGKDKHLFVRYRLGGKENTITLPQGAQIVLPDQPTTHTFPKAEIVQNADGAVLLKAWQKGKYELSTSKGLNRVLNIRKVPEPIEIKGDWTLKFPEGWGAPESIIFDELISWSEHPHYDIKHFSGTASYEKYFEIPRQIISQGHILWLDLGRVYNIAEVFVNGQNLGIYWKPPFRVNISDAIIPGRNLLEVKVTNLWPNRLIGDESKPDPRPFEWNRRWRALLPVEWEKWQELAEKEEQQPGNYLRQSGRYTWGTVKFYDAQDPLLESGIKGPVALYTQVVKTVI